LKELGPALVSRFRIDPSFYGEQVQADGELFIPSLSGKVVAIGEDGDQLDLPLHAMVLVGMKRKNNEYFLLLQNWWEKLQFVEMSAEYFVSSKAGLTWIPCQKAFLRDIPVLDNKIR